MCSNNPELSVWLRTGDDEDEVFERIVSSIKECAVYDEEKKVLADLVHVFDEHRVVLMRRALVELQIEAQRCSIKLQARTPHLPMACACSISIQSAIMCGSS